MTYVCMICIKIFQIYISKTSYLGASHDPSYSVFEKKVLHRCLSRILSKKLRKARLKKPESEWSLIISSLFLAGFFYIAILKTFDETYS